MSSKDEILKRALIHLGIKPKNNQSADDNNSQINEFYDDVVFSAIKELKCKFAIRTVALSSLQILSDMKLSDNIVGLYILPSDFLAMRNANGVIYKGKYFQHQPERFTYDQAIISYYAKIDASYFNAEFADYIALKLAFVAANIFDKTDSFMLQLEKKILNAFYLFKNRENYLIIKKSYL